MLQLPTKTFDSYSCPLCSRRIADVVFEYCAAEKMWPFYRCDHCDFSFIRPMPIELLEKRSMESIDDAELFSPFFRWLHERYILGREERSLRSLSAEKHPKLLDIGCGSGWTTEYWQNRGFHVEAVEPSKTRCTFARNKYGFTIHNCYVEDLSLENRYDIVVLRHILEHLEDPVRIISKVYQLLKEDGLILIIVPNASSIGATLFGRFWEWVLPWHCNFFTLGSLVTLLTSCNFTISKNHQSPSPLYYGESLGRTVGSTRIEDFFMHNRMANLMVSLPISCCGVMTGRGDNVTVIARKQSAT